MCRLSWFLDPGGWSKTATVGLYFIFPGICTMSLKTQNDFIHILTDFSVGISQITSECVNYKPVVTHKPQLYGACATGFGGFVWHAILTHRLRYVLSVYVKMGLSLNTHNAKSKSLLQKVVC
ncbi:hypothetical protein STEG23_006767 [Scotinomys teguina]